MEEDNKSAVAQAVERFDANIGTLMPAASWVPPSSSTTPTNCDMISTIHVKARWLIRMLAWVRATLDDAEDMDITEESICDWLRELQEVADAAEDLLDELPPEELRLGFLGDGGWTAGSITELPRQRKMTSKMARRHDQRMEDIVWRFMKIKKPEQALELDYCKEQTDAESIYARRTTSSVIEEPHIVGRDEELAKIKLFLLSSDAEESKGSDDMDDHVSVMAIVGMGGLGKTTLAQLAYQDDQVNQHFQLKSWVCVSEDFDVVRLTKAMLQSLNVEASGLSELDPLHRKLLQKLKGQGRLLLVLDDVWEAQNLNIHNWNLLTAPLRNRSAGTKVIITTRSRIVSEMAPRTLTHDLGFLSPEHSLELFMQHAFEGRDPNLFQNLVVIGKEIARRCGGVPLAAKTLGGLLRTKDDKEWNKILESEVWNTIINQEESIISILRLSYRHLPAPLKRCFRYCSLFAKDYVFHRNQLIRMWMAHGYIKANRRELMEDIGQRYIDNLLSRSFFQKHPRNPKRLQIHDLMHDLARCVSGAECYSMEGDKPCIIPTHVQHLSILSIALPLWSIQWSRKYISELKSFRSFLLPGEKFKLSISGHELPSCSYTRMEHLRVLDLHGVRLDRLPESIASLKHLRYLRISSVVDELPESVGSMYHLQTLDSRGVRELPNSMSNLLNLRHLILSSSDTIEYPVGIGKLTELQTVPGFRVSPKHNRAKLGELKDLNNIRGEFAIKGLENLADVNEARKACLDKKRNISSLHLEWDPKADSWHIDEEVLESLKPSVKLATLKILGFNGPSYPSWLGDGSFSRLGTIKLEHCENWTFLPPLGQLPSLRSLNISQARAVEYIGSDFLHSRLFSVSFLQCSTCEILPALSQLPSPVELYVGGASNLENVELDSLSSYDQMSERGRQATYTSIAFPRLQKLEFHDMPIWEEWLGAKEGDFPFLWKLVLKRCPRLRALPHLPPGLKELYVEDCEELQCLSSFSQGLKSLKSLWLLSVTNCPNLDFTATEGPPPKLELMYLTSCPLLLAWCEGHPRMLERIPNIWVDGVRVSPKGRKVSI